MPVPADVEAALADWWEAMKDERNAIWRHAPGPDSRKSEHERVSRRLQDRTERLYEMVEAYTDTNLGRSSGRLPMTEETWR